VLGQNPLRARGAAPLFGWPNGSRCDSPQLARTSFAMCKACAGSLLDLNCAAKPQAEETFVKQCSRIAEQAHHRLTAVYVGAEGAPSPALSALTTSSALTLTAARASVPSADGANVMPSIDTDRGVPRVDWMASTVPRTDIVPRADGVPRQRTHSGQEDLLSISDRAACDTILQGQQQQTNRSTDTRAGVSTAAVSVPSDANQPADGRPRVFNFGLLKTGTTSLHEALKALGIASCKWQPDFRYVTLNETAAFVRSPLHGSTRLHHVLADRRCSAVSDNPWWALYRTLMTAYPHAKLILTRWSGGCGSAGWMSAPTAPQTRYQP